jgi:hypothetical protein
MGDIASIFDLNHDADWKLSVVSGPRNHQGRTAASRRGGGRFLMGESQDLGQCAHDGDLAATARPAGQDFDSIDKANGWSLMFQGLLEFRYLFAIELRKIWVDRDVCPVLLGPQISIDLSFASFQAPQLIAHGAGVSVAPCYEVEAVFDPTLDILQFF